MKKLISIRIDEGLLSDFDARTGEGRRTEVMEDLIRYYINGHRHSDALFTDRSLTEIAAAYTERRLIITSIPAPTEHVTGTPSQPACFCSNPK